LKNQTFDQPVLLGKQALGQDHQKDPDDMFRRERPVNRARIASAGDINTNEKR
jgi:hypothetical protein